MCNSNDKYKPYVKPIDWKKPIVMGDVPATYLYTMKSDIVYRHIVILRPLMVREEVVYCDDYGNILGWDTRTRRVTQFDVVKGWLNLYRSIHAGPNTAGLYSTKEIADKLAGSNRLACIYVEVKRGEGLVEGIDEGATIMEM